ncbi:MAG TPA: hypothetical protein VJB59_12870 [Bdellovibrionota bacterium]|nr:hypothetical protein [Bdellovibrionota bacterium]
MLLPPAVKAFLAELEFEVTALCGARYSHGGSMQRWEDQEFVLRELAFNRAFPGEEWQREVIWNTAGECRSGRKGLRDGP